MSVYEQEWIDPRGRKRKRFMIDVLFTPASGPQRRIRRVAQSKTSIKEAQTEERAIIGALVEGTFGRGTELTYRDFATDYETHVRLNRKHGHWSFTEIILRKHLVPEFGRDRLPELTVARIARFKDRLLTDEMPAKTINNTLGVLRASLGYAVEMEHIPSAPRIKAAKVTKRKPRFLSFDDADALMRAAAKTDWSTMVVLALKTGMRSGELRALRWEDLNLRARSIHVCRAVYDGVEGDPKNGKSRDVGLTQSAYDALKGHRQLVGLRSPYVFSDREGEPLQKGTADKALNRIAKAAGLSDGKRFGWHLLRHTFASHLVMRGKPLAEVQQLLGHSTILMTERYAHLLPEATRSTVLCLDDPSPLATTLHQVGSVADAVKVP